MKRVWYIVALGVVLALCLLLGCSASDTALYLSLLAIVLLLIDKLI
jgi:hypothetical protein